MTSPAQSRSSRLPRLKRRSEFLKVARRGRKWAAPGVVVQAFRRGPADLGPPNGGPRVGFTVTRKVGNAVIRNRAKRRLRSAAEAVLTAHGQDGMDIVVIGRAATLKRSFDQLIGDLEKALRKLDAFRE